MPARIPTGAGEYPCFLTFYNYDSYWLQIYQVFLTLVAIIELYYTSMRKSKFPVAIITSNSCMISLKLTCTFMNFVLTCTYKVL